MKKTFFLLAMAISTMGFADYSHYTYPSSSYVADESNLQDTWATDQDKQIAKQIRSQLGGLFSKPYNLTVDVKNGQVTISGAVDTMNDKLKAEQAIKKVDGVTGVTNQITIGAPNGSQSMQNAPQQYLAATTSANLNSSNLHIHDFAKTSADRQINLKIRQQLSGSMANFGIENLTIRTNKGIVTLEGVVLGNDNAQKLVTTVSGIDGVRSVNNQLKIKNQ